MTLAPAAAKIWAQLSPIPRDAPVITTVRPLISIILALGGFGGPKYIMALLITRQHRTRRIAGTTFVQT